MTKILSKIISTFFFTGCFPVAPGTVGTGAACILYIVFLFGIDPIVYAVLTVLVFFLGVYFSGIYARCLGRDDPPSVVIDEVCGYLVTMLFLPYDIRYAVLGFFLFRLFDIFKPFPIRRFEEIHGGFGIVLDDVVAGVWSNLLLRVLIFAGVL